MAIIYVYNMDVISDSQEAIMKESSRKHQSGGSKELSARVAELYTRHWGRSAKAMAEDLGVSVPVIFRVVAGKQTPSCKLIEGLAQHPKMDAMWLLTGRPGPVAVPITQQALPGPPDDHAEILTGDCYTTPAELAGTGRYWLEVQPHDPAVQIEELHLAPRDLLLMATNPKDIPNAEKFHGQLCVVRCPVDGGSEPALKLGAVQFAEATDEMPARLEVDTFDLGIDPSQIIEERVERTFRGHTQVFTRKFKYVDMKDGTKRKVPVSDFELEPVLPKIEFDDIVAVCVGMVRRRVRAIIV